MDQPADLRILFDKKWGKKVVEDEGDGKERNDEHPLIDCHDNEAGPSKIHAALQETSLIDASPTNHNPNPITNDGTHIA